MLLQFLIDFIKIMYIYTQSKFILYLGVDLKFTLYLNKIYIVFWVDLSFVNN